MLRQPGSFPLLLVLFALSSCIEPTTPEFQLEDPFYLIEGDIADQPGLSEVRVRRSDFRLQQLVFSDVSQAQVVAESASGQRVVWTEAIDSPGVYLPPAGFYARVGERWQLRVRLPDGTQAISDPETVPVATAIDRLRLRFEQEGEYDGARRRFVPGFRILLDFTDPPQRGNSYHWDYRYWERIRVCISCYGTTYDINSGSCRAANTSTGQRYDYLCAGEDGCYQEIRAGRFLVADDAVFTGGPITGQPIGFIPFTQFGGLLVEGIQYGTTARSARYTRSVSDLVEGSTGLNATIPTALVGNVQNADPAGPDILGYVRVVSVTTTRLYLDRTPAIGEPLPSDRSINLPPDGVPPRPPCEGGGKSPVRPDGWPE